MPQKYEKYIDPKLDGRYKITPDRYPEVRKLYKEMASSRKVALVFGVTKNIITFIINPDIKEKAKQRVIENKLWKKYYNKKNHTIAIRKFREKKRSLGLASQIKKLNN